MSEATISRLVELHGEGGLAPTTHDWRRIFEIPGEVPLLNLLKFKCWVAGTDESIRGVEAYRRYTEEVAPSFGRVGARRLFFGAVEHIFSLGLQQDWDAAILTSYPSANALARMWLDPAFVAAHRHRNDGVDRSQVIVFSGAG